jgi:hypothetical protein
MIVHAGGAMTGMRSTPRDARNTTRYITVTAYGILVRYFR